MSEVQPLEVKLWLEWAGQRILSLHVGRLRPQSYNSFWPDYPDDKFTAFGYTGNALRPAPPSKDEIPLMDEILNLVLLVPIEVHRRVLNSRALIHPLNNRHIYSWSRIAHLIHSHPHTVKNMHRKGLQFICGRVEGPKVGRFRALGLTGIPS